MKYLFGYALGFFAACLLIYSGVQMLRDSWIVLLIVAILVISGIIAYKFWKNRPRW